MLNQAIDCRTGYVAPVKNVRVSNKVGQVSNHSNLISFAAYAMIVTAVVLVVYKAMAVAAQ
ncbi:hypothetical protein E0765_07070 [Sulfuricurvum sp. IAE1]|uniref:hypothetical protein n=1 Tax=Sulfuricurvum sp. IAE1 TaxID=2546102 RepID=UPI001053DBA4|nr:hypothetical protein [Sulfuricurvum sp. IAE1]TDA63589.1 hypothetical protein E0765_07070 [Sulfuricurvum sp. IAE1]